MGNITDPMFWRRFSMAAHQDDEEKASKATSSLDGSPALQHQHSWLDRQKKKKSQRTTVCWIFWIAIAFLVISIIVAFLLLKHNGIIGGQGAPPISEEDIYSTHGNGP